MKLIPVKLHPRPPRLTSPVCFIFIPTSTFSMIERNAITYSYTNTMTTDFQKENRKQKHYKKTHKLNHLSTNCLSAGSLQRFSDRIAFVILDGGPTKELGRPLPAIGSAKRGEGGSTFCFMSYQLAVVHSHFLHSIAFDDFLFNILFSIPSNPNIL